MKAMAFGTGVSRAAQRLREGEPPRPPARRAAGVEAPEIGVLSVQAARVWLVIGFLLGLGSSWAVTRRVRRVAQRFAPADVVDRWSDNVRAAVSEGRDAMRAREVELKVELRPQRPGK